MDPATLNPDDVMSLIQSILSAAGAKNWLLMVPLIVLSLISVFRLWIVPKFPALAWFTTDRGGALLALLGAATMAVVAAVATPGPHSAVSVIVAVVTMLVANQALFGWLKKLLAPTGADAVQAVDAKVAVATAKATDPTVAAASINEAMAELKK
jgi:hypothetical protein